MFELDLTPEEREEANKVKEIYQRKYMCSMGPVFEASFKKNHDAFESKKDMIRLSAGFLNQTYFSNEKNAGLPQNTREITGCLVWQSPCMITDLRKGIEPGIFLGRYHGAVNVDLASSLAILDERVARGIMEPSLTAVSPGVYTFPYTAELVTTAYEEVFMLLRSLWYFVESRVIQFLLRQDAPARLKELFSSYVSLRKDLIDNFFLDAFPEPYLYTKLDHFTTEEVSRLYDKCLFSQLRSTQKKSLLLAGLIKRELEDRP